MDHAGTIHDAFRASDLWKPSSFFQDPTQDEASLFAPLQLDVTAATFDHPYASKHALGDDLQLPDLDTFEFGKLPELESLDEPSVSAHAPQCEEEEDVWQIALDLGPANKDVRFFNWELFENPDHKESYTSYISESGPAAFNAALLQHAGKDAAGRVVRGNVLLESLWNLGLGRSSILFDWDAKQRTFVPAIADGVATGTSFPASKSLVNAFITSGNTVLYLRSFAERTFASASVIPAKVALATCVSSILTSFEEHIGKHSHAVRSILQLQSLFSKPRDILVHVSRIVDAVKHARSNEHLASLLHQGVLEVEGDTDLYRLTTAILCRVAQPSLELMAEWVGLRREEDTTPIAQRDSFVATEEDVEDQGPPQYTYRPEMMPTFISPEDGDVIFETGNSLRFLKLHHPDHPLARLDKSGIQPPQLEWKFGWEDIESISQKAQAYEEELRAALQHHATSSFKSRSNLDTAPVKPPTDTSEDFLPAGDDLKRQFDHSAALFDAPPANLPDELHLLTTSLLSNTPLSNTGPSFSPPTTLTSSLSFRPLLTAQAKLTNATTLRLFFRSHHLRHHLSLQRQYHLLGDGVFSSSLASALFDTARETAELQKGVMRSGVCMGLHIGARDTWPPASSELRLALMGVLSESYYSSALYHDSARELKGVDERKKDRDGEELPGKLAFAVRYLTEPEMQACMNPDALSALDFLRLQYVPPPPLHLILTHPSLERYDTIFKFLLRLLRLVYVTARLPRSYPSSSYPAHTSNSGVYAGYFRLEANHFVTALAGYIFQTGIAENWDTFSHYLSKVEDGLAEEDNAGELGKRVTAGLESLRREHEKCLDSIMFSLLLRRRQKKVMLLLEEIFEVILLFAKTVRDGGQERRVVLKAAAATKPVKMKELYAQLRGKVRVFISVCRGLTGKKGYGKGRGTGEENSLERLGVLLEMNGYFGGS